jgi:hypothetical protein
MMSRSSLLQSRGDTPLVSTYSLSSLRRRKRSPIFNTFKRDGFHTLVIVVMWADESF